MNELDLDAQAALKAELDKVRAARQALEAGRVAADKTQELVDELERERMKLTDEQAVAAMEEAHGPVGKKIAAVYTDQGVLVVKRPHHVLFKRFMDHGKTTTDELEKLVRPCVVYPDKAKFDRICEEQPGLLMRCANQVVALAGFRMEEASGK